MMGLSEEFLFNHGDLWCPSSMLVFGGVYTQTNINELGPADLLALFPVHSAEGAIAGEYLSHAMKHRPQSKLMTESMKKVFFKEISWD